MTKFTIVVSDTVTYARTCEVVVECESEEQAEEIGRKMTTNLKYPEEMVIEPLSFLRPGHFLKLEEDEIDNTPWEIEIKEGTRP